MRYAKLCLTFRIHLCPAPLPAESRTAFLCETFGNASVRSEESAPLLSRGHNPGRANAIVKVIGLVKSGGIIRF
jgi:hypothetical protein